MSSELIEYAMEFHGRNIKYLIVTKSNDRDEMDQLLAAQSFINNKIQRLSNAAAMDRERERVERLKRNYRNRPRASYTREKRGN